MSIEDLKRMQARKRLLGQLTCDHRGLIIPMVFIPQIVEAPGPDGKPIQVQIMVAQTAKCLGCPAMFTLGPPPPTKLSTEETPANPVTPVTEATGAEPDPALTASQET